MSDITVDDVRSRAKAAGLSLPEHRVEVVRRLLNDALGPLRRLDARSLQAVEPAATFDAAPEAPWRAGGRTDAGR
jgi:hypothetical protein